MRTGRAALARVAAAAGMLAATALAMLSLGALGVLGPLGAVIAGGDRSAVEQAGGFRDAAIIAGPSRAPAVGSVNAGGVTPADRAELRPVGAEPGRRDGTPPSGTTAPPAQPPAAPRPGAAPAPNPLTPIPPAAEPPPAPRVVDGAAGALEDATKDAPAPVRDSVGTVGETLRQTCRQLPACP